MTVTTQHDRREFLTKIAQITAGIAVGGSIGSVPAAWHSLSIRITRKKYAQIRLHAESLAETTPILWSGPGVIFKPEDLPYSATIISTGYQQYTDRTHQQPLPGMPLLESEISENRLRYNSYFLPDKQIYQAIANSYVAENFPSFSSKEREAFVNLFLARMYEKFYWENSFTDITDAYPISRKDGEIVILGPTEIALLFRYLLGISNKFPEKLKDKQAHLSIDVTNKTLLAKRSPAL